MSNRRWSKDGSSFCFWKEFQSVEPAMRNAEFPHFILADEGKSICRKFPNQFYRCWYVQVKYIRYRCTVLFKVSKPFQWIYLFFYKKFFFSFLQILVAKITLKKIPLKYTLVKHIYTSFFFCWRFSAYFCGYGTQNSKNTKIRITLKVFGKIS